VPHVGDARRQGVCVCVIHARERGWAHSARRPRPLQAYHVVSLSALPEENLHHVAVFQFPNDEVPSEQYWDCSEACARRRARTAPRQVRISDARTFVPCCRRRPMQRLSGSGAWA
jgi:hypothetical protein